MLEYFVLGVIQGITEWLPVSSDGFLILAQTSLFGRTDLAEEIRVSLFLHIGTFLSALIYFRHDVLKLLKDLFSYPSLQREDKSLINFYALATIISGILGYGFLRVVESSETFATLSGKGIMILVAVCLLITGIMLRVRKRSSKNVRVKQEHDVTLIDAVIAGIAQGFSALPGVSRSGTTVSALLLRKFDDIVALRLSFILSLPLILGANIVLSADTARNAGPEALIGVLTAFVVGILTIHYFMKLAKKIDFSKFVIAFAFLLLLTLFI